MFLTLRRYNKTKKNARKKHLLTIVIMLQHVKNSLQSPMVAWLAKIWAYFCVCTQVVLNLHLIYGGDSNIAPSD
jgi:ABC-type arginine/histidine transport system permease subunit